MTRSEMRVLLQWHASRNGAAERESWQTSCKHNEMRSYASRGLEHNLPFCSVLGNNQEMKNSPGAGISPTKVHNRTQSGAFDRRRCARNHPNDGERHYSPAKTPPHGTEKRSTSGAKIETGDQLPLQECSGRITGRKKL